MISNNSRNHIIIIVFDVILDEKKFKFDEFLPIFSQVKKEKDMGCFEDFNECLKLYDKDENGKMLLAELSHTLLSLG
jgi:Ca2+-binding EF-hand superfamily protein